MRGTHPKVGDHLAPPHLAWPPLLLTIVGLLLLPSSEPFRRPLFDPRRTQFAHTPSWSLFHQFCQGTQDGRRLPRSSISGLAWPLLLPTITGLLLLLSSEPLRRPLFDSFLRFEIAAYFKRWHLGTPNLHKLMAFSSLLSIQDAFDSVYSSWVRFWVEYIAPLLQFLADTYINLFLVQSVDRLILCLGCFWIKFKRIKHVMKEVQDPETGGEKFPLVWIQMPMCNEKEVYQLLIVAVCNLDWPRKNMLVQVLDDSDDPTM